jgi:hypothetical protein
MSARLRDEIGAMVCSFCGTETVYLAEGPYVSICEACVNTAISRTPHVDVLGRCTFCRKDRNIVLANAADAIRICSECIQIARQVIEHKRANMAAQ